MNGVTKQASLTGLTSPGSYLNENQISNINGFINSPSRSPVYLPNIGSLPSPNFVTSQPLVSPLGSSQDPQLVSQFLPGSLTSTELIKTLGNSVTSDSYGTPTMSPIFESQDQLLSNMSSHDQALVNMPSPQMSPVFRLSDQSVVSQPTHLIRPVGSYSSIPMTTQQSVRLAPRITTIRPLSQQLRSITPTQSFSGILPSVSSGTLPYVSSGTLPYVSSGTLPYVSSGTLPSSLSSLPFLPSVSPGLVSPVTSPSVLPSMSQVTLPSVLPNQFSPVTLPSVLPNQFSPVTLPSVSPSQFSPVAISSKLPSLTVQTPVMPVSEASNAMEFATPSGLVEDQDILKLMVSKGFQPFNVVMVQTPQGNMAKYIKAISSNGNTLYVVIDREGNVMTQPGDLTTVETNNATSIPLSAKIDAYNCAGLDVCAVALECGDGVCMLMRDDDAKMKEIMLTKVEKRSDEALVESDSPIGYPVVRLSEILQNPVLVTKIIDTNTRKIRTATMNNYIERLGNTIKSSNDAINNVNMYVQTLDSALVKITGELKQFEKERNQYDILPSKNSAEKQKFNKLTYSIRNHNDLLFNLFKISKNIDRYTQIFNEISNDSSELTNFITESYM